MPAGRQVHLIISSRTTKIEDIVRDFKKYTSKQIIAAIQENNAESRKEWMLNIFWYAGENNMQHVKDENKFRVKSKQNLR